MDKIEKIRQEIERRKGYISVTHFAEELLSFLDTLSEEPRVDVTDFCKPIDPGIAQCVADHWWEMLDGKEPDKSLEEAAEEYNESMSWAWEAPNHPHKSAFIAGAKWQKTQMMKDAVEGYVNYYEDSGGILMAEAQVGCPYHNGDKVRIIIIKEKEENK